MGVHFSRRDENPIPKTQPANATPEIAVEVKTEVGESRLGCLFTLGTRFEQDAPYELVAKFRALYSIEGSEPLDPADVKQFAYWNALFNVWPYWREYVSSTVNRAHLPQFTVPVIKLGASSLEFQTPIETP
jgi:preprotein translocase subunit SecB